MEKPDVNAIAARMVEAVKLAIARSESGIAKRLEELDARIKALPAPAKGDKGDPGESIKGEKGDVGERGESLKGDKGEPGKDGKDSDPVAVRAMVDESVAQSLGHAVALLPAPKDGKDGAPGKDGASIKGDAGEPGRDAAELDILPSIDEAKSYRRGTWASHNGGLIRASRQTDAVKDGAILEAGWVVMVEGLSGVVVTQGDDPREIGVAAMLTSGAKIMSTFRMPAMVWRDIWREGEYERGDIVTWGGSSWHCQQKTKGKPGECDDWKMMVKKGSAGRDWNDPKAKAEHKPVRLS